MSGRSSGASQHGDKVDSDMSETAQPQNLRTTTHRFVSLKEPTQCTTCKLVKLKFPIHMRLMKMIIPRMLFALNRVVCWCRFGCAALALLLSSCEVKLNMSGEQRRRYY